MQWLAEHKVLIGTLASILSVTIASIITALTKYPNSAPANEAVAILQFVQMLLDRLSILPHQETIAHIHVGPVGLNMLLARSRRPDDEEPTDPQRKLPPGAVTSCAVLIGVIALSGCCALHGTCTGPTKVIVDCGSAEVKKVEANLGAAVLAILQTSDYEAALTGLAAQLGADGMDVIGCVISNLLHPGGVRASYVTPVEQVRAEDWLRKHGVR